MTTMPRTVGMQLRPVISFPLSSTSSSSPMTTQPMAHSFPSLATLPSTLPPTSNTELLPCGGSFSGVITQYEDYVSSEAASVQAFRAKDDSKSVANTKIQMMYVVESQRGSPALFVVNGWMIGDNARWFNALVQTHPLITKTMDFSKDGYQELPEFDVALQMYNLFVEGFDENLEVNDALYNLKKLGLCKEWKRPSKMKWVMVGIENHTLVMWMGPHRVIEQPGYTTHIYINPEPKDSLLQRMKNSPQLTDMMQMIRLHMNSEDQNGRMFPLHEDTQDEFLTDDSVFQDRAQDSIRTLNDRSWDAIHFKHDHSITNAFHSTKQDLPYNRWFQNASTVAKCCALVAPFIRTLWHELYELPHSTQVAFPPTQYTQYADDDTSPFFPPHIDYKAHL